MVSTASLESSSIQLDVHFVIHGPIESKIDGGYLVTDMLLSHRVLGFSSRSQLFTEDVQMSHSHH